jgi:hypothetical protein
MVKMGNKVKFSEDELQQKTWEAFLNCIQGIPFLKDPPVVS